MKFAIIFSLSLFFLFGQDSVLAIVKNSPGLEHYPQAGAIILFERITEHYTDKGREREVHLLVKLLNDRGIDEYGDQKVEYDKMTQEVQIIEARTIMSDLSIVRPLKTAISDVSAIDVAEAPAYANAMVKVVSFPALDKNAVIDYHYKLISKYKEPVKFIWGGELFQYHEPIIEKQFRLIIPDKFDINHKVLNGKIDYRVTTEGRTRIYTWRKQMVEQIIIEENMPPQKAVAVRLIYSSAKNWVEVGRWFAKKFYNKINFSSPMKDLIGSLVSQSDNQRDKIKKIVLYVVSKIRSIYLDPDVSGYIPLRPSEIMMNKYGIALDKAMLLIALLKELGVEANPVLGNYEDFNIIEEVPSAAQLNDVWVMIRQADSLIWIDPTAENCSYGYFPPVQQSRPALIVRRDSSFLYNTVYFQPEMNTSKLHLVLSLDDNGNALGDALYELKGYPDILVRSSLKDRKEREREIYFASTINYLGQGATIKNYITSDLQRLGEPAWVKFSFFIPNYGVVQEKMIILKIPLFNFSFSLTSYFPSLIRRNFDYVFAANYERVENIDIKIPNGYTIAYLTEPTEGHAKYLQWKIKLEEKANMISFKRTLIVKDRHILLADYTNFKKDFENFSDPKNLLILLKKKEKF